MIKRMIDRAMGRETSVKAPTQGLRCTAGMSSTAAAVAVCGAAVLAGCAGSPDSHFYTLGGDAMVRTTDAATSAAPSPTASPLLIEVMPVNVPSQVSRPQIVTTTGAGNVDIQDYERWSSPLADEVSTALSQSLTRSLGAIDVYRTPRPVGSTMYRVTVNVQRFESVPGDRATIEAVWSVVRSGDSLTLTCRSQASESIGSGYEALAAGHRKALARIAGQIAQGVRAEQASPPQPPQSASDKPTSDKATQPTIQPIRRASAIACPT